MDLTKIEELYNDNIDKFGLDSKSVGWPTHGSQNLRFEKLLLVVEDREKDFELNELGCGYGELFRYCKQNKYNVSRFNGYDISERMLEAAKTYINSDKAFFYKEPVIKTQADYTVTSGIFNVKFDHQLDSWKEYIKQTLKNMFENSRKGISFNLLTKYVDFRAENLYYADPEYYFNFCKTELSRYVTLSHDYDLYEWTILVKK